MADVLDEMTKEDLAELARQHEIEGRSSMDRDQLIKAVRRAQKGGVDASVTTPRPDNGVTPTDEGNRLRGETVKATELPTEAPADQSSQGGTVTGTTPPRP